MRLLENMNLSCMLSGWNVNWHVLASYQNDNSAILSNKAIFRSKNPWHMAILSLDNLLIMPVFSTCRFLCKNVDLVRAICLIAEIRRSPSPISACSFALFTFDSLAVWPRAKRTSLSSTSPPKLQTEILWRMIESCAQATQETSQFHVAMYFVFS